MGCIRGLLRLPVCPCSWLFIFRNWGNLFCLEIENERLRQIRLHERVNDLPDPNYSTLKYFLGHLHRYASPFYRHNSRHLLLIIHRINEHASENQMSMQNLAIVLGPTLFGQPMPPAPGATTSPMPDTLHQNLVCFPWFHCTVVLDSSQYFSSGDWDNTKSLRGYFRWWNGRFLISKLSYHTILHGTGRVWI